MADGHTRGYWPGNHNLRYRLLDFLFAGYEKARGYLMGSFPAGFFWLCWMAPELGQCVYSLYHRGILPLCVLCGKQCRFLFGFREAVLVIFCYVFVSSPHSRLPWNSFLLLDVASKLSAFIMYATTTKPQTYTCTNTKPIATPPQPSLLNPKTSPNLTSPFPPHPATPCSTAGRTRIYHPQTRLSSSAGPITSIQD